jgi:hypothetical protein
MPLELCPKCKGMHYKNAPCIVRDAKSTAARMDVQRVEVSGVKDGAKVALAGSVAGTQALPVDTPKPIGRPRIHPDRKAYKAQHERDRRAKLKARKGE